MSAIPHRLTSYRRKNPLNNKKPINTLVLET